MRVAKESVVPGDLQEVSNNFERWRGKRRSGAPIPESLWVMAVEAAARHGLNRVAQALGLNHSVLRDRLQSFRAEQWDKEGPLLPPVRFVELPGPDAEGAPAEEPSAGRDLPDSAEAIPTETTRGAVGPIIQLRAADGARMRIQLPQNQSLDLPALVASFCGRHL